MTYQAERELICGWEGSCMTGDTRPPTTAISP